MKRLSLFSVLLGAGSAMAQSYANVTVESHSTNCSYTGQWASGSDYQTVAAGASFTCEFYGNAVYVIGQVCAAPYSCLPTESGTFTFTIDSADPQQFVTPTTLTTTNSSTDGFSTYYFEASNLIYGPHIVTGTNVVAGKVLWFQRLRVAQQVAGTATTSTSAATTTQPLVVVTTPNTATTADATSSVSSSSATETPASTGVAVGSDNTNSSTSSGSSTDVGAIVGGVVGGVGGLAVILLLAFCLYRRKRKARHAMGEGGAESGHYEKHDSVVEMTSTSATAPGITAAAPVHESHPSDPFSDDSAALPYTLGDNAHNVKRKPVPTQSAFIEGVAA